METALNVVSHLTFAVLAAGYPGTGTLPATATGAVLLCATLLFAWHLHVRDSTPRSGVVLCVAAAASLSVRLLGGAFTPAVAVYPLLFLWMRMPTIEGPLYHAGIMVSVTELLGHLSPGWGTPFAMLNLLPGGLAAFAAPFLSMFGADLLLERHSRQGIQRPGARREAHPGFFPEDVARSMLPLLHRATGANGVFLVVRDGAGALRLSDFLASSGSVPESFLPAPSDPFMSAALRSEGLVTMDATVDRRLPWYMEDPGTASVVMIPLSRNGVFGGVYVCDFFSRPAPAEAGEVLLDSAGVISSAWGDTASPSGGMLTDICIELGSSAGLKAAVHSMVVNLARHVHSATVTVAVLTEDGRELQAYETLGSMSSARRGRLFPADKGVAGWAVSNRRVVLRRAVGRGDSSIRPFISDDDPQQQVGSCCAVPLYSERAVFGVLVVESSSENGVTPEHSKQLEAVGAVFGVFSARMAALERIESLSERDRLTGLPCYSAFQEELLGLVDDVRKGLSVAVLAVDICGFRALNAEYGPRTCDTLLGDAAKRIADTLGKTYTMTRFSPGRFLVCIPGADRAAAQACAVRIMEAFSVTPFAAGERELSMPVAVGGAVSRVDRMVPRLPGFAGEALGAVLNKGAGPAVLSVDQFGKTQC